MVDAPSEDAENEIYVHKVEERAFPLYAESARRTNPQVSFERVLKMWRSLSDKNVYAIVKALMWEFEQQRIGPIMNHSDTIKHLKQYRRVKTSYCEQ